jgi:hypothetical protein
MKLHLSNRIATLKWIAWILLTIAIVYWRFGYSGFANDLLILDLKGMNAADPSVLRGDWFTEQVPQPHWIYDAWVSFFYGLDFLAEAKVVMWVLTLSAFAVAVGILAAPTIGFFGTCLVILLTVMGPVSPLGSGTLMLGWTLPHCWGACGAFLAFALTYRGYLKSGLAMTLLVPFLHAQHGLHIGLIVFLLGLMQLFVRRELKAKSSGVISICGFLAIGFALAIAKLGSVTGLDDAYDRVCQNYAPFHCFSSTWPASWWVNLAFLVPGVLLLLFGMWRKRELRAWALTLGLIFAGYMVALAAEFLQIAPLDHLVRTTNAWRWISFFAPLAVFGYLQNLKSEKFWKLSMLILPLWLVLTWQWTYSGIWESVQPELVYVAVALTSLLMFASSFWKAQAPMVVWCAALLSVIPFTTPPKADYQVYESFGKVIENSVPPGELIMAAPSNIVIRRMAKRAIVADFKGVPYSDPYLGQYEERIRDLGGFAWDGSAYWNLPYPQWIATAQKYKARYALVQSSEPRFEEVRNRSFLMGQISGTDFFIFRLNDVP